MAYPGRLLGRDLERLRREMDRLFVDFAPTRGGNGDSDSDQAVWAPRADLAETEDAYVVALDVPGVPESDLQITLDDDTLKVAGERKFQRENRDGQFHRIERSFGRFYRAFRFASPIEPNGVTAEFEDGVLTVRVAKAEASKPRHIEVRRRTAVTEGGEATSPSAEQAGGSTDRA
jgi:HSP20 family protein